VISPILPSMWQTVWAACRRLPRAAPIPSLREIFPTMSNDLNRMPPQTKYIVGNEACERFSYYGVVSILTIYATGLYANKLGVGSEHSADYAKETVHWFKMACYAMPLIGAWIADRYWGRYKTILLISLAYCVGHALLSAGENTLWGLFAGLTFIAIGSGGIKPCVSAFAGDQFAGGREHLIPRIYSWFYWSINFGAFFAFQYIPQIAKNKEWGYAWAFGLPGIAMGLATLIFWMGRKSYQHVPPQREAPQPTPEERAEDRRILWKIVGIFATIPFFWCLFDQQHTTWVKQGNEMTTWSMPGLHFDGETMQSVNAIMILVFVPIFVMLVYPAFNKAGLKTTPLRRMGTGFFLAAASFIVAAWVQARLDAGIKMSVMWQLIQYGLLTAGEVLISTTGLEFAFTRAPIRLRSTIMSFWSLTVAFGNGFAALVTMINRKSVQASVTSQLLFYAGVAAAAGIAFALIARNFPDPEPVKDGK
jgi:proton-dependent oligopeptide transporter, POT family